MVTGRPEAVDRAVAQRHERPTVVPREPTTGPGPLEGGRGRVQQRRGIGLDGERAPPVDVLADVTGVHSLDSHGDSTVAGHRRASGVPDYHARALLRLGGQRA